MKRLMMTAAASALMLGAAACSNENDLQASDNGYETETSEAVDATGTEPTPSDVMASDTEEMNTQTVFLTAGQMSADELIGTEVIGADGEAIATLDDLLINNANEVESVIFRSGDFIDLIGTKGALAFDQLEITPTEGDDPRVTVSMTEEAIQQVAEFEQEGLNDYRLASEIIGTTADFADSDESGRINDVIISETGEAEFAILSNTMMVGEERLLPFERLSTESGEDAEITIDASPADFRAMPLFNYQGEDAAMDGADGDWDRGAQMDDTDMADDRGAMDDGGMTDDTTVDEEDLYMNDDGQRK